MSDRPKTRLIFHGGLNKCGSSYLQELFAYNFSAYPRSQVSYPKPHAPTGNAGAFSRAVRDLDKKTAVADLRILLDQMKQDGTVLISTEFMYHQFVKTKQRNIMHSCFLDCEIKNFTFVFVFRNVFEHAVSAYCHRCGIHAMPPFENWIVETPPTTPGFRSGVTCYEFWAELRLLLATLKDERFKMRFIPYSRKMESDWSDFLGVEIMPLPHQTVNVSVTPSEGEILRRLRDSNGFSMAVLRQQFKAIDRNDKANDFRQTNYYHSLINQELERHSEMINQAEHAFGFEISKPPLSLEAAAGPSVNLNERQLDVLVEYMDAKPRVTKEDRVKDMVPESLRPFFRKAYQIFHRYRS